MKQLSDRELLVMVVERMQASKLSLRQVESIVRTETIKVALANTDGHLGKASRVLGIHRNTLMRSMNELQISARQFKQSQRKKQDSVAIECAPFRAGVKVGA